VEQYIMTQLIVSTNAEADQAYHDWEANGCICVSDFEDYDDPIEFLFDSGTDEEWDETPF
jgi:hypothetical protein